MRGITEERLKELSYTDDYGNDFINTADALAECAELNPWQPIELAPENKQIRLFVKSSPLVSSYQTEGVITDLNRHQYSHWQELPDDPY